MNVVKKFKKPSLPLLVGIVILLALTIIFSTASTTKAYPISGPPSPCPAADVLFGRCIDTGYYSGVNDSTYGAKYGDSTIWPIQTSSGGSPFNYTENVILTPINRWAFPQVPGCTSNADTAPNCTNTTYLSTFLGTIEGFLEPGGVTNYYAMNATQQREASGAAMIVLTMEGVNGTTFGAVSRFSPGAINATIAAGIAAAQKDYNAWSALVTWFADNGYVNWDDGYLTPTPHFDSTGLPDNDAEFFLTPGSPTASILFFSPTTGQPIYGINRSCGNIFGAGTNPPTTQLAALSCGSLNGLPEDPQVNGSYSVTVSYNIANNSFMGGNITVSASSGITGLPYSASTSGSPGTVTVPAPPSAGIPITLTSAGNYVIDWTVSGGNSSGSINCSQSFLAGYYPYFGVEGGDVKSGTGGFTGDGCNITDQANAGILSFNNGFNSSTSSDDNDYGSGDNLAAFAPNLVDGFATSNGTSGSGAAYATTKYSAALTFANSIAYSSSDVENFGGDFANTTGVGTSWCSTNYYATASTNMPTGSTPQPPVGGVGSTVNLSNLAGQPCHITTVGTGSVTYCWFTGPINFTDTAPLTGNLVVYVDGDSYINNTGVSLSQGPWSSVSAIPTFYLVDQGNINISYQAAEIDGVYVAQPSSTSTNPPTGYISTCTDGYGQGGQFPADGSDALYSNCDNSTSTVNGQTASLTINGAVVAKQLRLGRTYGNLNGNASSSINNPAELFTYNPSVWLNDPFTYGAVIPPTPVYLYEVELPPVL